MLTCPVAPTSSFSQLLPIFCTRIPRLRYILAALEGNGSRSKVFSLYLATTLRISEKCYGRHRQQQRVLTAELRADLSVFWSHAPAWQVSWTLCCRTWTWCVGRGEGRGLEMDGDGDGWGWLLQLILPLRERSGLGRSPRSSVCAPGTQTLGGSS